MRKVFKINNKEITAGGLILYKKNPPQLLLIHSRNQYEDFGGRVSEEDDDIYITVARETYEESNKLLNYDEILKRIKGTEFIYSKISKYAIFIIEANEKEEKLIGSDFGSRELHDDIERTVEWIDIDNFFSKDFNKKIAFRIKNKYVFDAIHDLLDTNEYMF